jgi:hypothetical protein
MSKTVAFFSKANSCFVRLASHVLVPVEHHLRGKGRITADLDRDVAPFGIEDMKGVVVYVGHGLFVLEMVRWADIPDGGLGTADEDEKQALGDLGLGPIFFCDVVFALLFPTVDDRNVVRLGVAMNVPTETTSHAHQMGVVQCFVGPGKGLPPSAEPTCRMPHPEVSIEDDTIDAIVAADEKILVNLTESICHSVKNITGPTLSKATHSGF